MLWERALPATSFSDAPCPLKARKVLMPHAVSESPYTISRILPYLTGGALISICNSRYKPSGRGRSMRKATYVQRTWLYGDLSISVLALPIPSGYVT